MICFVRAGPPAALGRVVTERPSSVVCLPRLAFACLCLPWLLLSISTNAFLGKNTIHHFNINHHHQLPLCSTPPRPCTALSRRVSGWPRSLALGTSHLPNRTVPGSPICVSCIPRAGVASLVALLLVTQKDP